MKSADIKPGEVYAYQGSRYGTPDEVIFLTPLDKSHFYQAKRYRKEGEPHYTLDERATSPRKDRLYGNSGYLVAIGSNVVKATLAEAISPEELPRGRGYQYSILLQTTKVIGLYQEVMAERQAQAKQDREERRAQEERNKIRSQEMVRLHAKFTALGVDIELISSGGFLWTDSEYTRKNSPPRAFELTRDQAEVLVALLEDLKEGR